ncbi:MAG: hypothetical protein WD696_21275 [Bryobacteraceae bacterium]
MTRYLPARHYLTFGVAALALAGFSAWIGLTWPPAFIPAVLFFISSILLVLFAFRPPIEIHDGCLVLSGRAIPWMDIRRLDRTGWISPLIVRLTLFDDSRILLIYPGDLESCKGLLRQLRRCSRDALIDGVPYRQYWGEVLGPTSRKEIPAPRFRVLRPEDEAEVERLYQRLKTVGNLDQKSSDEK